MKPVLVVGAGLAGLACARQLQQAGHSVLVLEKSRGPGGRASTRRADPGSFDHGAQYFTVSEPEFEQQVHAWHAQGVAQRWDVPEWVVDSNGKAAGARSPARSRWVGAPGMNALGQALAQGLTVRTQQRVTGLQRRAEDWLVRVQPDLGPAGLQDTYEELEARAVVLAIPAEQARPLLQTAWPAFATALSPVHSLPCWAVMLAFDQALPAPADILRWREGLLAWAARDSSKPGRAAGERWVLHFSPHATQQRIEAGAESVIAEGLEALGAQVRSAVPQPIFSAAHRWLYALSETTVQTDFLFDPRAALGVCGDALIAGRIESAWLSGHRLGQAMIRAAIA